MPSSISSSEATQPIPRGPWGRTWLLGLVLCLVLLGGLESYLRLAGYRPSVIDDKSLWTYWRQKASAASSNTTVLLGNSRMQLGFSPEAWKNEFPNQKVVQLAVDGGNPLPVLKDLASDASFHGRVICDIEAWIILRKDIPGPHTEYLAYFHKQRGPAKEIECLMQTTLESHIDLLNPGLGPSEISGSIVRGRFPGPQCIRMRRDRSVEADYNVADLEVHKQRWTRLNLAFMPSLGNTSRQAWHEAIRDICDSVQNIRAHGGEVIFVRFPSSGQLREIEEKYFPRALFWDDFAKLIGAQSIHFEDVSSLRGFKCPEDSHLDERDAPRFTRLLGEELIHRGLIARQPRLNQNSTEHVSN